MKGWRYELSWYHEAQPHELTEADAVPEEITGIIGNHSKSSGTIGSHWRLPEVTGDYRKSLAVTGNHRGSSGIAESLQRWNKRYIQYGQHNQREEHCPDYCV